MNNIKKSYKKLLKVVATISIVSLPGISLANEASTNTLIANVVTTIQRDISEKHSILKKSSRNLMYYSAHGYCHTEKMV